jgi:hypothetical protein
VELQALAYGLKLVLVEAVNPLSFDQNKLTLVIRRPFALVLTEKAVLFLKLQGRSWFVDQSGLQSRPPRIRSKYHLTAPHSANGTLSIAFLL